MAGRTGCRTCWPELAAAHTCTAIYYFYYFYLHSSLLSCSTLIYSSSSRRSTSCCPSPAASSSRRTGRIISPLLLASSPTLVLSSDLPTWQPGNPINGQHPFQVTSGEEHRLRKVERWIRFGRESVRAVGVQLQREPQLVNSRIRGRSTNAVTLVTHAVTGPAPACDGVRGSLGEGKPP